MTHDFPLVFPPQEQSIVEVLEQALDNLRNPDNRWDFAEWTTCTCGHIYMAAAGEQAAYNGVVTTPKDKYPEVLVATAHALGWDPGLDSAADYVSDYTRELAGVARNNTGGYASLDREYGIQTIEDALDRIRAMEVAAMRALVA